MKEIAREVALQFVQDHSDVKLWVSKIGSENTWIRYVKGLLHYCEWSQMSPTELLAFKHNQTNHDAEKKLDLFVLEMKEQNLSKWSLRNIVIAVKSFHKHNYEDLASNCGRVHVAAEKPRRTPDQDSLNEFVKQANPRDRALIMFLASAPVRAGTLVKLKWSHISNLKEDTPHIQILGKDMKGKGHENYRNLEQHCFLTPQAKQSLLEYKEWREQREGKPIKPEDPLFASVYDKNGEYPPLKTIHVRKVFSRRSQRTGIEISPHDLRRFVQTQLERAGMNPNWIRKIVGHKVSGEESPYSQPKIDELREAFRKAFSYLTIQPTGATKIKDQEKEIAKLKAKLNEFEKESEDFRWLRENKELLLEGVKKLLELEKESLNIQQKH